MRALLRTTAGAIVLLQLAALAWGVSVLAAARLDKGDLTYASDDQQSAFLRNYSPNTAIEPFRLTGFSSMEGRGSGAGAGEGFTTHTADFERYFTVRSAEKVRLMVAVSEDLERALIASGAEITSKSGDAVGGYHFEYVAGQTKGSVTISPLGPGKTMRRMPLPAGSEDIALMIDMKEKWFVQPGKVSKAQ